MSKLLSLIKIFAFLLGYSLADQCGDWMPFKDEKCFKVFDVISTQTEAQKICNERSNGSVLAIINSSEEQELINKYLKNENIVDNVWFGNQKFYNSVKYLDETEDHFNNWSKSRPLKNSTECNCVEMSVDETNFGKWSDVKCQKKNAVLCQKIQAWPIDKIQKNLFETMRVYNNKIEKLKNKLDSLITTPVPIGFIYAQFAGQSEPKTLWPNAVWENISGKYSGLFFRAEGGESSPFGKIQEQQIQSLEVSGSHCEDMRKVNQRNIITENFLGNCLYTGNHAGPSSDDTGINMRYRREELRPRNQAFRIWQRIK